MKIIMEKYHTQWNTKIESKAFNWLFVDYDTLREYALQNGLQCQLVIEGEHNDYLAKITLL